MRREGELDARQRHRRRGVSLARTSLFSRDGSTDSMPDTPELREHYGVPRPCREGLGFPMSHLMMLMDHRSGFLIDCRDSPLATSDLSHDPGDAKRINICKPAMCCWPMSRFVALHIWP
jgi:hypothetical protein